jgi:methionyl-tRNA formyltransferase
MIKYSNIAVFGCKSTTLFLLRSLSAGAFKVTHLITIDPESGHKNEVADYYDLTIEASKMGTKVYQAKQYSLKHPDDISYVNDQNIDIAFVIGWQRLIPEKMLARFTVGAFGMHGSSMNLPLGRGRSPMNWSILEGRKVFYTNLFKYNEGVDSGDVLDTFKFQINERDTGETMHYKNLLAMKYLIGRNIDNLANGDFSLQTQRTDLQPTYYPKRTPDDSQIDWSVDVIIIERFIRAVTRPFNGAFTFVNSRKVIIWNSQVFDHSDFGYDHIAEGCVAAVFPDKKFLVKCFGGLLLINEYTTDAEIAEGDCFGNGGRELRYFRRNQHGFFDVEE